MFWIIRNKVTCAAKQRVIIGIKYSKYCTHILALIRPFHLMYVIGGFMTISQSNVNAFCAKSYQFVVNSEYHEATENH